MWGTCLQARHVGPREFEGIGKSGFSSTLPLISRTLSSHVNPTLHCLLSLSLSSPGNYSFIACFFLSTLFGSAASRSFYLNGENYYKWNFKSKNNTKKKKSILIVEVVRFMNFAINMQIFIILIVSLNTAKLCLNWITVITEPAIRS